ncbi:DUF2213 domain-containing protein [Neorhizobium sp. CSC1952]|uniref:DUF2213 domain-containing protein n=1 Tax=Neorhizobium sp. CSC1952 TaxID=2978974 RepID=UPI0025A501F2|nr:DUF2213 domain-containing protein [Rhizobium sp. CSC1952]WJR66963.1 DUF2213 domain-containing protein [Rhizobium sp. CSC1952]
MQLFDTVTLDGLRRTQDGYLVADARVARTGIQLYTGLEVDPEDKHGLRDKAVVRVYRPEEEVFAKDAMHSYAYRPVTEDHPSDMVTADNWKEHAVGQTGGEVVRDGEFVRVPLVLMDKNAIAKVEGGKRELSMGYSTELKFQDGVTPQGEQYDAIQTSLRMNHLAVVSAARGGSHLKIGDKSQPKEKDMTLKTVTVDGIPVEVTDQGATVINTLQQRLVDAGKKFADVETAHQTKLADAEKAHAAAIAEKDKALAAKDADLAKKDAEIDTLKGKIVDGAALDKLVADRADLVATAKAIAKDVKTEGLSDADIRKAAVVAKLGDAAVKDKAQAYIDARFDILAEDAKKAMNADPFANVVRDGLTAASDADKGVTDAYTQMIADMKAGKTSATVN